jgi:uncharacterized protein YecT (DUF1311 family)
MTLFMVLLSALGAMFQTSLEQKNRKITAGEIVQTLWKQSECNDPESTLDADHAISIQHVQYFDFNGDGQEEAIVVASTCMTGTAGPDVHSVFTRNSQGELVELPLPDVDKKYYEVLFGNRNYDLTVRKGLLVAAFTDTSDRKDPLLVRYRWNGRQFIVDSIHASEPYKTSYECTRARKESERAICYVKPLADLDLQLAEIYRARLAALPSDQKKTLREDQRKWLLMRDSKCTIYKWWVECLTNLYTRRIAELKSGDRR